MIDLDLMMSIIKYSRRKFHASVSQPGTDAQASAVLRLADGGEWFGIILRSGELLVRCSGRHAEMLMDLRGFSSVKGQGDQNGIKVRLDENADREMIRLLLNESFVISGGTESVTGSDGYYSGSSDEPEITYTEVYSDVPLSGMSAERSESSARLTGRKRAVKRLRFEANRSAADEGRDKDAPHLPEVIQKLRDVHIPSYSIGFVSCRFFTFYIQARIAADYEDDFEWSGSFARAVPVYNDMNARQLRGYFAWRTALRRKDAGVDIMNNKSFVLVNIYEILCGAGVMPEDGLERLLWYRGVFQQHDAEFADQIGSWIHDYIIYYHLKERVSPEFFPELETDRALALFAGIEEADSDEEYFCAINKLASYRMDRSSFLSNNRETAAEALKYVFSECSKQIDAEKGRSLADLCFGGFSNERISISLFRSAVFYDWRSPGRRGAEYERAYLGTSHASLNEWAGETFTVDKIRTYARRADGRWELRRSYRFGKPSKILGAIVRETDRQLRTMLDTSHPLKKNEHGEYFSGSVSAALKRYFSEKEKAERPEIKIDMSALADIRRDAALTRDSLIVEDDDGADAVMLPGKISISCEVRDAVRKMDCAGANSETDRCSMPEAALTDAPGSIEADLSPVPPRAREPDGSAETEKSVAYDSEKVALSDRKQMRSPSADAGGAGAGHERFLLEALLYGKPYREYFKQNHLSVAVVADSVNEIMMDAVGDIVIDFDGSMPVLIEDYEDDIREWLEAASE